MGGAGSREDFGSSPWRSPGPPDADSDATQEIPGFGGQWRDSAGQDRPQDNWAPGNQPESNHAERNRPERDRPEIIGVSHPGH